MNRQTVVGKGSAEIKVYKGKSVFEGIAIGKIRLIKIKKRKFQGTLIVDPDSETLPKYVKKEEEERSKQELLLTLKGKETVTKSGKAIQLYANIGGLSDLQYVLQNDAAGIGLFRSEFLYLEKSDYPTEEEQFQVYKSVDQTMAGKKVIIRTLDIGADKQIDYFNLQKEENPAMGFRAIRICLKRPEIFKTQLRALYRASVYGNIAIMFPMITSVWEIRGGTKDSLLKDKIVLECAS